LPKTPANTIGVSPGLPLDFVGAGTLAEAYPSPERDEVSQPYLEPVPNPDPSPAQSDTDGTSHEEFNSEDPSDVDDERRCDNKDTGLRNPRQSKHFTGEDLPNEAAETGAFSDTFSKAFAKTGSIALTTGTFSDEVSPCPKSDSAALSSPSLGLTLESASRGLGLSKNPHAFRLSLRLQRRSLGFKPNHEKARTSLLLYP
jgi:hypothetical protein